MYSKLSFTKTQSGYAKTQSGYAKTQSGYAKTQSGYAKKFVYNYLRASINMHSVIITHSESESLESNFDTHTIININPYTVQEQFTNYPIVITHYIPSVPNTIINIE